MNVYRVETIGPDSIPHVKVMSSNKTIHTFMQDLGGVQPLMSAMQSGSTYAALNADGDTTIIVMRLGIS